MFIVRRTKRDGFLARSSSRNPNPKPHQESVHPYLIIPAGRAALALISLLAFNLKLIARALAPKPIIYRNLNWKDHPWNLSSG